MPLLPIPMISILLVLLLAHITIHMKLFDATINWPISIFFLWKEFKLKHCLLCPSCQTLCIYHSMKVVLWANITRFFFTHSHETLSNFILDLVHFDICELMQIFFLKGAKYFISFTDDYFWYTYVYHLKQKFEAFVMFQAYKVLVEKQNDCVIKMLCINNGG